MSKHCFGLLALWFIVSPRLITQCLQLTYGCSKNCVACRSYSMIVWDVVYCVNCVWNFLYINIIVWCGRATCQALDQRGQDLSLLRERTERMADRAAGFAEVAAKLAEKSKKWTAAFIVLCNLCMKLPDILTVVIFNHCNVQYAMDDALVYNVFVTHTTNDILYLWFIECCFLVMPSSN